MKFIKNHNFNDKGKGPAQKPIEPVLEKKGSVSTVSGEIKNPNLRVTEIPKTHPLAKIFLGGLNKKQLDKFMANKGKSLDLSKFVGNGNHSIGINENGNLILRTDHDYNKGKFIITDKMIDSAIRDYLDYEVKDDVRRGKFSEGSKEHVMAKNLAKDLATTAMATFKNKFSDAIYNEDNENNGTVEVDEDGVRALNFKGKRFVYIPNDDDPENESYEIENFSGSKNGSGDRIGLRKDGIPLFTQSRLVVKKDDKGNIIRDKDGVAEKEKKITRGIIPVGNSLGLKGALAGSLLGGLISAPVGAVTELISGDKKKSKLKRLLLGGLTGGLIGAGLGGSAGYISGFTVPWISYKNAVDIDENYLSKSGLNKYVLGKENKTDVANGGK